MSENDAMVAIKTCEKKVQTGKTLQKELNEWILSVCNAKKRFVCAASKTNIRNSLEIICYFLKK